MRAYANDEFESIFIEDDESIFEFYEPDPNMRESCEDWTYFDCKNYMRHNEATSIMTKELPL